MLQHFLIKRLLAQSDIAEPKTSQLYAAGPAYVQHARRIEKNATFAEDDEHLEAERQRLLALQGPSAADENADIGDEPEDEVRAYWI